MTDKQESDAAKPTGLALMRHPFEAHQISKLPKPTKQQTEAVKADFKQGFRCPDCGGWHHPKVDHLDYVGHAALTDRLLESDPAWDWQPMALTDTGLPLYDGNGGIWIRLTVCGVTRLGYGNAAPKQAYGPGDRDKEIIGDALRNAAMRFGAALDLWHKGDLHVTDDANNAPKDEPKPETITEDQRTELIGITTGYGFNPQKVCVHYKIKDYREIPADEYENVRAYLDAAFDKKRIKEQQEQT